MQNAGNTCQQVQPSRILSLLPRTMGVNGWL